MDVFGLQIGQSMTVNFTNDILQSDGTTVHYILIKWKTDGLDFILGPDYGGLASHSSILSDWTITFESLNPSYNEVNQDPYFLEFLHKFTVSGTTYNQTTYPERQTIGVIGVQGGGSSWYDQINPFANSNTGEITDNDERFIQLLSRNGNVCEVYIFAYINGQLHYLEGQFDGDALDYHPTAIDPSIQMSTSLAYPLWYPVDSNNLIIDPNSYSKWTMTIQS